MFFGLIKFSEYTLLEKENLLIYVWFIVIFYLFVIFLLKFEFLVFLGMMVWLEYWGKNLTDFKKFKGKISVLCVLVFVIGNSCCMF